MRLESTKRDRPAKFNWEIDSFKILKITSEVLPLSSKLLGQFKKFADIGYRLGCGSTNNDTENGKSTTPFPPI